VSRVARPVIQPFVEIPLPGDEVFAAVKELILNVDRMRGVLADPAITSIRLVLNLEKMVIKEAQRAYTYFSLFGYATDAVVVNRVLPEAIEGRFMQSWAAAQQRYQETVREAFTPLPILSLPFADHEIIGRRRLLDAARDLYGSRDPAARLYTGVPQTVKREGRRYVLSLAAPFTERRAVDVLQREDDLVVRVGSYKRTLVLPRSLAGLKATGAHLDGDRLLITFGEEDRSHGHEGAAPSARRRA
jgi:arsenite-transporting ATPase